MKKYSLRDLCADADAERKSMARWIKILIDKGRFKKTSLGYGYTETETKKICNLLSLDFDKIKQQKNNIVK
jgi:hypothetical protein